MHYDMDMDHALLPGRRRDNPGMDVFLEHLDYRHPPPANLRAVRPTIRCPLCPSVAPKVDFKNAKLLSRFTSETGKVRLSPPTRLVSAPLPPRRPR